MAFPNPPHSHRALTTKVVSLVTLALVLAVVATPIQLNASSQTKPLQSTFDVDRQASPSAEEELLEGRLVLFTGDPDPAYLFMGVQYLYAIRESTGYVTTLDLSEVDLPPGDVRQLVGQRVRVLGHSTNAPDGFLVRQIWSTDQSADRSQEVDNNVFGPQSVLVLLCQFPDKPANLKPPAFFRNMFEDELPGLGHYWRELSFDKMSLDFAGVVGPSTLPHLYGHYVSGGIALDSLGMDCLEASGIELNHGYDVVNMFFNAQLGCCAYAGYKETYLPLGAQSAISVVAHEMGHVFGLHHSSGPTGVYTSGWDVMSWDGFGCNLASSDYGCLAQHTIGHHKDLMGWLGDGQIFVAPENSSTTITIRSLAQPSGGGYLLGKVPVSESGLAYYTVEARTSVGYDVNTPGSGIVIHLMLKNRQHYDPIAGNSSIVEAVVVDGDDNQNANDYGAIWLPGETFEDEGSGIRITVQSQQQDSFKVTIERDVASDFSCANSLEIERAECDVLQTLYHELDGDGWVERSGWGEWRDVCNWFGITCVDGSVQALDLSGNNLSGPLPNSLLELKRLRWLLASGNQLTGSLPSGLGDLIDLEGLYLGNNQLSGSIPVQIDQLVDVVELDLSSNLLTGPLPATIGDMTSLHQLNLRGNQLSGSLPATLGNMSNLHFLDLGSNQFSGLFPSQITQLVNLEELILYDNQLSGPLPTTLGDMTNLRLLWLGKNKFNGSIPAQLGELVNLDVIDLNGNQLSGPLPATLGELTKLRGLFMGDNQFSGPIPLQLGNLESLEFLHLEDNQLSGPLPTELADLSKLKWLWVYNNPLSGAVPRSLTSLSLESLYFDGTSLCEPPGSSFQAWLNDIPYVRRTNTRCLASVEADYTSGAPGSFFAIRGIAYEPDAAATVKVNGVEIGTLMTDVNGDLAFALLTAEADEGGYEVEVGAGSQEVSVYLEISSKKPLRADTGLRPLIALPPGIAIPVQQLLFMPYIADR